MQRYIALFAALFIALPIFAAEPRAGTILLRDVSLISPDDPEKIIPVSILIKGEILDLVSQDEIPVDR